MDNEKLKNFLSSIAMVIDDEIFDESSSILKIVEELEKRGTLFVKRNSLLDNIDSISNFSFIILDWDLKTEEEKLAISMGVSMGATLSDDKKVSNRNFIKQIITRYFIPIFIFSQENIGSIKAYLEADDDIKECINKGRIFLCDKSSLKDDQVITSLNNWLNDSMAVYTFKIMDESLETAKHRYFNEMNTCDLNWPCYVYQNIKEDNPADINSDFQEFLMTSFTSTVEPISFNGEGFNKQVTLDSAEIIKIFSKIKFLSYREEWDVGLHPGDLYVNTDGEKEEYFINVSASCDMRKRKCYFVAGVEKSSPRKYDIICSYTVKHILNKKGIEFSLDNAQLLSITDVNKIIVYINGEEKTYSRIGRLLNPYISALQNKFSSYITRTGVCKEP